MKSKAKTMTTLSVKHENVENPSEITVYMGNTVVATISGPMSMVMAGILISHYPDYQDKHAGNKMLDYFNIVKNNYKT